MKSLHDKTKLSNTTATNGQVKKPANPLPAKALEYALLGWFVVPLHNPIFDDNHKRTGCTCEAYYRSETNHASLEKRGQGKKFDPNYICASPGKHPRLKDWEAKASNDPAQIAKWWRSWPLANIGIATGPSGLLDLDFDTYKGNFDGADLLTPAEQKTPTNLSGSGGQHLLYQMPDGKRYGNATGDLPQGIDIRGWGGQFVAPPSIHPNGKQYEWEDGFSPWELPLQPLPEKLIARLDAAQPTATAAPVVFNGIAQAKPDLTTWRISSEMSALILKPPAAGQRSEADYSVVLSLAYAGATDDEIYSIFQHYPIGTEGKFSESGDRYLARTIRKARGYVETNPRPAQTTDQPKLSKSEKMLSALRNLNYQLRLNRLEDMVEVDGRPLDDILRSKIELQLVDQDVPKTYAEACLNVVASENSYHPIQDYLNNLRWDGTDYLGLMLQHMQSDGTTLTCPNGQTVDLYAVVIRRWLLGCVARGLDGDKNIAFKHQTPMLVIVAPQGLGKSSWVRWLVSGVGYQYHRESALDPHHPDHIRTAVNKWIWEVSELGSTLRRSDKESLKGFITQEWHTYRKPWGRSNITKPTLCNLVGTLNPETGFLDDVTGHRRFLPVTLQAIDHKYRQAVDVNQLWAQIVSLYKGGESPDLASVEREAVTRSYEEHEVENPLQTFMQMYFIIEPGNEKLKCFTADIIQRLQMFEVSLPNHAAMAGREINSALAPMGLTRKLLSIDGIKGKGWIGIAPGQQTPPKP